MSKLDQLRRLLMLRKKHEPELNPIGLRLIDKSITAIYEDCLDIGEGYEAMTVLAAARLP